MCEGSFAHAGALTVSQSIDKAGIHRAQFQLGAAVFASMCLAYDKHRSYIIM